MKYFLILAAAGLLVGASCSRDQSVADQRPDYEIEADRIADRIAQDLNLRDTVVVTRIERVYVDRGRRLADVRTRYATDTTGRYAALRDVNDDTDREVRTILGSSDQYRAYETNRGSYYTDTPYTVAVPAAAPARRGPEIVKYERDGGDVKIEYANGTKVKIDEDGDRKVKHANGTKRKYDADDGEYKVKR